MLLPLPSGSEARQVEAVAGLFRKWRSSVIALLTALKQDRISWFVFDGDRAILVRASRPSSPPGDNFLCLTLRAMGEGKERTWKMGYRFGEIPAYETGPIPIRIRDSGARP